MSEIDHVSLDQLVEAASSEVAVESFIPQPSSWPTLQWFDMILDIPAAVNGLSDGEVNVIRAVTHATVKSRALTRRAGHDVGLFSVLSEWSTGESRDDLDIMDILNVGNASHIIGMMKEVAKHGHLTPEQRRRVVVVLITLGLGARGIVRIPNYRLVTSHGLTLSPLQDLHAAVIRPAVEVVESLGNINFRSFFRALFRCCRA